MEDYGNGLIDNIVMPEKGEKSEIIKIIGVGGAGCNAVNNMVNMDIRGVNLVVCNTDIQALDSSPVHRKIQLGKMLTSGLGAGNNPDKGRDSAIEAINDIEAILKDNTQMVFVTAGMGGGTGTGAAPVIAKCAKDMGLLTIGIVNIPYGCEGKPRIRQAIRGAQKMSQCVDSLLVVNTDRVLEMCGDKDLPLVETFNRCDRVMSDAARAIAEMIQKHNRVNIDFADVQTAMSDSGCALMGIAEASGDNRAERATEEALNSPLLNNNKIDGAKYVLVNITTRTEEELKTSEFTRITEIAYDRAGGEGNELCQVIYGAGSDETLEEGVIRVVVVATGFENDCFDSTLNKGPIHISLEEEKEEKSDGDKPVVIDFVDPKEQETDKIIKVIYGGNTPVGGRGITTRDLADPVCLPLDRLTEEELANIEQRPAFERRRSGGAK